MQDDQGRVQGTTISYNTLYKHTTASGYKLLCSKAHEELKTRTAKRTLHGCGWQLTPTMLKFHKQFKKRMYIMRVQMRKISTNVALREARAIYIKLNEQPDAIWPVSRRKNAYWKPGVRWVQAWFRTHHWRPRKAKNKRKHTPEEECQKMQVFVDKFKRRLNHLPSGCVVADPMCSFFLVLSMGLTFFS